MRSRFPSDLVPTTRGHVRLIGQLRLHPVPPNISKTFKSILLKCSSPTMAHLHHHLQPILVPEIRFTNWGHTFSCAPLAIFEPESVYQCQLIVELAHREGKVVRAVGVGHSPSDLACTSGYMLRTTKLNRLLEVRRSYRSTFSPVCTTHSPGQRRQTLRRRRGWHHPRCLAY